MQSKNNEGDAQVFSHSAVVLAPPVFTGVRCYGSLASSAKCHKESLDTIFIKELTELYPEIHFRLGNVFKYRAGTVFYGPAQPNFGLLVLHELGHALSKHRDYNTHAERIKIESEAWERAKNVLLEHPEWEQKYGIVYDEEFIEEQLDTYRDWLHEKSRCRKCGITCYQTPDGEYHCPRCQMLLQDV